MNAEQCKFGYRDSLFKHNSDLIITAEFQLTPGDSKTLSTKVEDIRAKREEKIPSDPSAGCVFKNIPITAENKKVFEDMGADSLFFERGKVPTAWLIERADLKGMTIGGAMISDQHANMIINMGNATASDVLQLISVIKSEIRDRFSIQLEEEIQLVGF
jgi:UDP-N-acetylmuramate dehydrogenase